MREIDLIEKLSSELRPVQPVESVAKRLLKWLGISILCISAGISLSGLREDWQLVFRSPVLLFQNVAILLGIITSAAAALLLSVPGNEKTKATKFLVIVPVVIWVLILMFGIFEEREFHPGMGVSCATDIFLFGILPGLLLFFLVRKGAALLRGYAGFLVLLASAGTGAWALQFTCHNDEPAHILLWHFFPMVVLSTLGILVGRKFLRRI